MRWHSVCYRSILRQKEPNAGSSGLLSTAKSLYFFTAFQDQVPGCRYILNTRRDLELREQVTQATHAITDNQAGKHMKRTSIT